MGFVSFVGRVLFASAFLLSAYQEFNEFGTDGGPAAKAFQPKFNIFKEHATDRLGIQFPHIELKQLIATNIALKAIGGILFILSSPFGAYLLLLQLTIFSTIAYDFYHYDIESREFVQLFSKFTQNLALFGALLIFLGMKNTAPKRQTKKKATKEKAM